MTTLRRTVAGLLLAATVGTIAATPAQAGYGNHAERATANVQTRVGLAKIYLLQRVNSFQVVETRGGFPPPQP